MLINTHTVHHCPTFFQAWGCTFWLLTINIKILSYQITMETSRNNKRTHLGKRCPLGLWHRDPTGCLKLKSMTNLRLRVEDNIGWLGQRQVCQCFYFWHIVTYLNHPIPITSSTLTTSQCLAKQTLSLLWLCLLVLFYTFDQADAECAFTHAGTVCTYLQVLLPLRCALPVICCATLPAVRGKL